VEAQSIVAGVVVGVVVGFALASIPGIHEEYVRNSMLIMVADTAVALVAGFLLGRIGAKRSFDIKPRGPMFPFPQAPLEIQIAAQRMRGFTSRGGGE